MTDLRETMFVVGVGRKMATSVDALIVISFGSFVLCLPDPVGLISSGIGKSGGGVYREATLRTAEQGGTTVSKQKKKKEKSTTRSATRLLGLQLALEGGAVLAEGGKAVHARTVRKDALGVLSVGCLAPPSIAAGLLQRSAVGEGEGPRVRAGCIDELQVQCGLELTLAAREERDAGHLG
jgi:hypothetical protein